MSMEMDIVKILLVVIGAPILGCLIAGVDRRLTARLQGRVGPPILQPYYDVVKLFKKENMIVHPAQNFYVIIYLFFVILSLLMLVFRQDMLMIIFVFTISSVALIVGGMSTGSPYAKVGSSREIMAILSYEPILILYALAIYLLTGTFKLSALDTLKNPLLFYIPLIFISMMFVMNIKFKKSPFDYSTSHHAHQELVKGMLTEYSGPGLGVIEVGHFYEYVFLLGLMYMFGSSNIILGLILAVIAFLFIIIMDNITARVYWQWMLRISWTILLIISLANTVILYYFKYKAA
jgi:ech hydrogenase subunit B